MKPVEVLKKLVEFPTFQTSLDRVEEGMKDCARYLSDQLEGLGFKVKVDDLFNVTGERVFGGEKVFLMNTHFDTVSPAKEWVDALEPKLKGKELVGLGASKPWRGSGSPSIPQLGRQIMATASSGVLSATSSRGLAGDPSPK